MTLSPVQGTSLGAPAFGKKFPKGPRHLHHMAHLAETERIGKVLRDPQYADTIALLKQPIATQSGKPKTVQDVLNAFKDTREYTLRELAKSAKLSPWQTWQALKTLKKAPFIKSAGFPFVYKLNRYGFQARTK